MEKNLILKLINLLAIALLAACLLLSPWQFLELNPYFINPANWSAKHQIINLLYNSYHGWSFDPLLSRLLAGYQNPALILAYSLFFMAAGWFLLLRKYLLTTASFAKANLASFTLTVALLLTLGFLYRFDFILLSAFTWLPFFILATQNFLEKKFTSILYLLVASVFLIYSSNQLSILLIPFFMALLVLQNKQLPLSNSRKTYQTIVFFLITLSSCFYILYYPKTKFFDYLANQRVLPQDFISGLAQPLFGPVNPVKFLELNNISDQLAGIAPCLFIGAALLVILFRKNYAAWALFIFNLCLLLDQVTSFQLKHIMPLETLSRLAPHWSFFAIAIVWSAVSIFGIMLFLLINKKAVFILPFLSLLAASHLLFNQTNQQTLDLIKAINNSKYTVDQNLLNSPAAQIILDNPEKDFYKRFNLSKRTCRPIKKLHPTIIASNNNEDIGLLFDKDPETSWTTKLARQTGKEWIVINFPKLVQIEGLDLSSGNRHTDFPRGLRISTGADCLVNDPANEVLYEKNNWIGSFAFTNQAYPYYTHESKVKFFFPRKTLNCLRIEQTGKTDYFDWSINEIKFLK